MTALPLLFALGLLAAPEHCAERQVFGLIVGYNGTKNPKNRPLSFADDDAARAAEWLGGIVCAPEDLEVLIEPDDTTHATFDERVFARSRPPNFDELRVAVKGLAARIEAAKAKRIPTELYIQYSGHGDLEDGLTSLTLADRMLPATDLEDEVLVPLAADRVHLIVDACNAGYLLAPRGAQTQLRLKASVEGVREFFLRLPNVGVVLSTSKAQKSYEDARFESGIFSHVVRSGLMGGADADLDRRVSYGELHAFVSSAFKRVRPATFRPEVFVAAPGSGDPRMPVAELFGPPLVRLEEELAGHFFIEDERRVRHADVHKASGRAVAIEFPTRATKGFTLKKVVDAGLGSFVRRQLGLPEATVDVRQLDGKTELPPSRGGETLDYEGLFEEAFDPPAGRLEIATPVEQAVPDASFVWGPSVSVGLEEGVHEGLGVLPELVDVGVRTAYDRWSLDLRLGFAFASDVSELRYGYRRIEATLSPRYALPILQADGFAMLVQGGVDVGLGLETQSDATVPGLGPNGEAVLTKQSFDGLTHRSAGAAGVLFVFGRSVEVAVELEAGVRLVQFLDPETSSRSFDARRALGGRLAFYYVIW